MSRYRRKNRKKQLKKAFKKHPFLCIVAFFLAICIAGGYLHYKRIVHLSFLDGVLLQEEVIENPDSTGGNSSTSSSNSTGDNTSSSSQQNQNTENSGPLTPAQQNSIISSDLSIHFLELGNKYSGDCTLIKVGNTEVLIDAGSRKNSATTLKGYIDHYCTDGILEYVIATHAHQDHIAGFVGTKSGSTHTGLFYQYQVQTLIQFSRTDATTVIYQEYQTAVDYLKDNGTSVYTALECWEEKGGASKTMYLNDTQTVSMHILYNYFYDHKTEGGGGENEYSVCMLLKDSANNNYLFTGDLEEKGEEYLVQHNPDLPKCKLFKGGHHGSYTASSQILLSKIQPEIVCVCCCCGSSEYNAKPENVFPAQDFVDRVAEYTDKVYVTTIAINDEKGDTVSYASMNGNIVLYLQQNTLKLYCSNNVTKLKDTAWFKANRITPSYWSK